MYFLLMDSFLKVTFKKILKILPNAYSPPRPANHTGQIITWVAHDFPGQKRGKKRIIADEHIDKNHY
jgi:hypothetical protein